MLAQEVVLEAVINKSVGYNRDSCEMIDSRDYSRLSNFFPASDLEKFGYTLKDGVTPDHWEQTEWTEDNILKSLTKDLEFAVEKAHGERGISSSLMYEVIQMWLWILEDPLAKSRDYNSYGMPLYNKVAEKYHILQEVE